MQVRDITLRDALDRLAAAAQFSLAYSSDVLPLDQRVCATFDSVPAGSALERLLSDIAVRPVAGGEDRVVLAPVMPRSASPSAPFARHANMLARVVITGSAVPAPERALTTALDVVTAAQLQQRDAGTLAAALDGAVPGLWIWSQPPGSLLARYGSIRGASSFGLTYPKMYIDGIEVANPLLVTQLSPDAIERIEVIRGPQGAALYGADALGGVVNVITKHQGTGANGEHVELRSGAGMAQSAFSPHPVFVQDHTLDLRGGADSRSGNLSLTVGSTGAYVPAAGSQLLKGSAGVRFLGARTAATGTARFYAERAGVPVNPLLAGYGPAGGGWSAPLDGRNPSILPPHQADPAPGLPNAAAPESERQYTLGGSLTFAQSDRWTHSLVVGLDGYRLTNVPPDGMPVPSVLDSALRAAQGGADRALIRAGTVARFGSEERVSSTLSLALEQTALRTTAGGAALAEEAEPFGDGGAPPNTSWQNSTGFVAQSSTAILDALFVTGGVRLERDDTPGIVTQKAVLPMLGAAFVQDVGGLTVKLRGAYGRGIRPARTAERAPSWRGLAPLSPALALAPESQEGIEAGADLLAGSAFGLHLTRFDQLAFGLIQPVTIDPTGFSAPGVYSRHAASELQNVGAIANRGWELASSYTRSQLTLTGSLSLVDSRVRRVAAGYTGDLRAGDRMLAVPARTASLDAAWSGRHWTTSWTLTRASDWMNYDRVALARAVTGAESRTLFTGTALRDYWLHYTGVTRLRATWSHELRGGMAVELTGDNLLNRQRGEPDDATIVPGRTAMVSLRASF